MLAQNDPKIMSAFDRAVYETLLNRQEEMEARLKKAPETFQTLFSNRKIEEIGPNVKGPEND